MMNHKLYIPILFVLAIFLTACSNEKQNPVMTEGDWEGFEMSTVMGSDLEHAVKKNHLDGMEEEGFLNNGIKTGTWLTYHPIDDRIKTIDNYINGHIEGLSLELDKRGQVIKKMFYKDGEFDGPHTTYKFGRPQETIPYSMGQVDGRVIRYYNNGRVMEEIEFKDGVQHGYYHHYNADEKLDMRYEYKNGEKISGGMVDPNKADSLNITN